MSPDNLKQQSEATLGALWLPDNGGNAGGEIDEPSFLNDSLDRQVGGDHYKKFGDYQPWQVARAWLTEEEFKGAVKLTVMKYLAREADKGGRQDIEKAAHTLQIYLDLTSDA